MKTKKQKVQKSVIKKCKFKDYKNCLQAAQIENKINHLEKNKIDVGSLKKDKKEFMKNNKLTLKTQQRLKVKGIMFLLKKVTRLLQVRMMIKEFSQLIGQKHACRMNKNLVCKKEVIKCNNIVNQYRNV